MTDHIHGLLIGADSGIGRAIGYKVIQVGANPDCWHTPGKGTLDIRSPLLIRDYIHKFGPYDRIVYSAGVNNLAWVSDLAMDSLNVLIETFMVNTFGFIDLMAIHEREFPGRSGSAVVITSDAAERPMRGSTAYCASKAATNAAMRCMARELAPRWRINAVAPGMTDGTRMTDKLDADIPAFRGWTPEKAREYEQSQIPAGRRATVYEVADLAVSVLNGPEYMTGSIVTINGGR